VSLLQYVGKETIEEKIAEGKIAAASTNATKALVPSPFPATIQFVGRGLWVTLDG
jgi:hypothetical protein